MDFFENGNENGNENGVQNFGIKVVQNDDFNIML
jgi:hypothetical protein